MINNTYDTPSGDSWTNKSLKLCNCLGPTVFDPASKGVDSLLICEGVLTCDLVSVLNIP